MSGNRFLLLICGIVAGMILLFFATLYVFVPTYRFTDPSPFSGKYIHNPYQNLTNENWRHIDLRNDSAFNAYEYGYGLSQAKYLCLDYKSKRKIDYPLFQNIHFKQYNINCLGKNSSLVVPTNLHKGFKTREIKHLDNYKLMEVMSDYGYFFNHWDLALSSGRRVNILATSHLNEFKHSIAINQNYTSKEQIIKTLKDGDFYAISYKDGNDDLPQLKNASLKNDTIYISADKMMKKVSFIGQNGIAKNSLSNINQGVYVFKEEDTYIRAEINFDDGTTIYLNPIVRHKFQYFFDPSLSEMMRIKTWLMRIVYLCVVIFFTKYLLSNKKDKVDEDKRK